MDMAATPNHPVPTPGYPIRVDGHPETLILFDSEVSFRSMTEDDFVTERLLVTVVATLWGSNRIDFDLTVKDLTFGCGDESKSLTVRSEHTHLGEWD